jgi:hypothetical protein
MISLFVTAQAIWQKISFSLAKTTNSSVFYGVLQSVIVRKFPRRHFNFRADRVVPTGLENSNRTISELIWRRVA